MRMLTVQENLLSEAQKKQAIQWLANDGYDLVTVAQHFGLTRDQLAAQLRNTKQ